jgi:hypothetical protein
MVEPNTLRDTSTWSPALHRLITTAMIAAMPVAVATACSAPSSAAMRSSNARTVGLV